MQIYGSFDYTFSISNSYRFFFYYTKILLVEKRYLLLIQLCEKKEYNTRLERRLFYFPIFLASIYLYDILPAEVGSPSIDFPGSVRVIHSIR